MLHNLSVEEVQNNVASETNIEVLRNALILANQLITALDQTVVSLLDDLEEALEENEALFADAERYTLVKFTLPAMLEIATKAGANSPQLAEVFGRLTPDTLDEALDSAIAHGALDELRAAYEADQAEAAQGSRLD
jgi:AraC-like DNA-binding protein